MRIELSNLKMLVLGHTDCLVINKEVPPGIRLQLTGRGGAGVPMCSFQLKIIQYKDYTQVLKSHSLSS